MTLSVAPTPPVGAFFRLRARTLIGYMDQVLEVDGSMPCSGWNLRVAGFWRPMMSFREFLEEWILCALLQSHTQPATLGIKAPVRCQHFFPDGRQRTVPDR
jgi:hypothetical protein